MLSPTQVQEIRTALAAYDYPKKTINCATEQEIEHPNMRAIEASINTQLTSNNRDAVRDGLSVVVHWGYLSDRRHRDRWKKFRQEVTNQQIQDVMRLFANRSRGKLKLEDVTGLDLPVFSGVSLTSKLLMFLDPACYVVLDSNIAKLKGRAKIFDGLGWNRNTKQTQIRVTPENQRVYEQWCSACQAVAAIYLRGEEVIAVDVERAIFQLIRQERLDDAAELANAFPG